MLSPARACSAGIPVGSYQADEILTGTTVGLLLAYQHQPPEQVHTAVMLFSLSFTYKASLAGARVNMVLNVAVLNLGR